MQKIIVLGEKELISPVRFYYLCQKYKFSYKITKLYFLEKNLTLFLKTSKYLDFYLIFLDYLSQKIKQYIIGYKTAFYLRKVLLWHKNKIIKGLQVKKYNYSHQKYDLIFLQIIGEGMVGRVAQININGTKLAFKSFFYPDFVWLHGPWGEIPVGIYLKANYVTKNFAEFILAGETWTIWEWIEPDVQPNLRKGITYEQFASEQKLTPLNYLNRNNYNYYQIRLDAGGVQKEYYGRRLIDFIYGILFYAIKAKNEGIFSLAKYFNKENFIYTLKRLKNIILATK